MPWYWVSHLGSVPCASYPYRRACASVSWEARKWLTEVLVERRSLRSPLMRLLFVHDRHDASEWLSVSQ